MIVDLIAVHIAPEGLVIASLNNDGSITHTPATYVGFANKQLPEHKKRWFTTVSDGPWTEQWVTTSPFGDFVYWVDAMKHSHTNKNGSCMCGSADCTELGVGFATNSRDVENWERYAEKRLEWLKKRNARKEYARAYNARRKDAATA